MPKSRLAHPPRPIRTRGRCASILAVALVLMMGAAATAQGIVEQLLSPRAQQVQIRPRLFGERLFSSANSQGTDRYDTWKSGLSVSFPVKVWEREGAKEAREKLKDETLSQADREAAAAIARAPGFLSGNVSYDYRGIRDRLGRLPNNLSSTSFGFLGMHEIEKHERPNQFGAGASYTLKTDNRSTEIGDGQVFAGAFLVLPSGKYWTLIPGVVYSSDFQIEELEGIPLPFFAAAYAPSRDFNLVLGIPYVAVKWSPYSWLELRGVSIAGVNGEASVSLKPTKGVSFRHFVGTHGELYNLTGEQYPKDTRLLMTGTRAGIEFGWEVPKAFTLTVRWEHQLDYRVRTEDKSLRYTDETYRGGQLLHVGLSWSF